MPYLITSQSIAVSIDGKMVLIPKTHADYDSVFAALNDEGELRRILFPSTMFVEGEQWRTRSGGVAKILEVEGKRVTVEIDDCYEMDLVLGSVIPGHELPEDLMERIE